jgi:hypothetical protein
MCTENKRKVRELFGGAERPALNEAKEHMK